MSDTEVKVYKDAKAYNADLKAMTAQGFTVLSVVTTPKTALGGRVARLTVAPDVVVTYHKEGSSMTDDEQEAWLHPPKKRRWR